MATETTTPANTTTQLAGGGPGGDKMDESLVTQSDGATQAKRARIVVAGDADGSAVCDPTTSDPATGAYALPVRDVRMPELVALIHELLVEIKEMNNNLRMLLDSATTP